MQFPPGVKSELLVKLCECCKNKVVDRNGKWRAQKYWLIQLVKIAQVIIGLRTMTFIDDTPSCILEMGHFVRRKRS